MPDVIITPSSGIIEFKPSTTTVNKIEASGNTFNLVNTANPSGTIFNIEATNGSLFSVVDNLSGTLMSVNNNAGLPVFEVFSDDRIVGGRFGQNDFVVSGSGNVGIGVANPSTKLEVSGTITATTLVKSGGTSSQFLKADGTVDSSTYLTSLSHNHGIADSAGTQQFTFGINDNVRIAGGGATSIAFDTNTKQITISSTDTNTTYSANSGVTLTGTTFSHTDTSSQDSVDNSNGTVIQDITLDTYGHVTGLGSVNLDDRYYTESEVDSNFARRIYVTRTLPSTINNYVNIGDFSVTNGAINIDIGISVSDGGFSVAKRYLIASNYNETTSTWKLVAPISDGGIYNSNDFILEAKHTNASLSLRIVRTLGSSSNTARITMFVLGASSVADCSFNASTATGTTTPATDYYPSALLSMVDGVAYASGNRILTTVDGGTFYLASNPNGYTTNTGTVTSVAGTGSVAGLTLTGTVTTTGSLTLDGTLSVNPSNFSSQTANTFLAAPNGSAGTPTFRTIVASDIPTLNQNTTGTAANITATSNTTLTTLSNLVSVGTIATGVWSASTIDVNKGGTGATTFTSGEVLVGNGTSAVSTLSRSGIDSRSTFPPSSHSITAHSATAWRMFFSNATTSAIQELSFGSSGTYLRSAGASANPTWATIGYSELSGAPTNIVTGTGISGHVSYWSNSSGQSGSSNFLWDNANKQLQIGTASSSGTLYVHGSGYCNDLNVLGYLIPESLYGERIPGTIKTHKLIVDSYVASGPLDGPAGSIDIISAGGSKTITLTCTNYPTNNSTFIFPDVSGFYTVVAKDANGDFSAGTITAALNGNASTVTSGVYTTGDQSIGGTKTFTSQIINTAANNTNAGAGQIYLNGVTGNRIDFNTNGVANPSTFIRSLGTKINLYPSLSSNTSDFAIGIGGDGFGGGGTPTRFWQSVASPGSRFEWYAGTTNIATLEGGGQLTLSSNAGYTTPTLTLLNDSTTDGSFRFFPMPDGAGGYVTFNSSANTTTNGVLVGGTSTMTGYHVSRRQGAFQWVAGTSDSTSRFEFLTANGGTTAQTMTSRMAITAQGRVGIGTNTPSYNLELVGSMGLNNSNGTAVVFDTTNYAIIMIDSSANNLFNISEGATHFYDQSGGAGLYFDRNNAKVGIRTPTPSEALEVDGNIKADNIFHPFLLFGG